MHPVHLQESVHAVMGGVKHSEQTLWLRPCGRVTHVEQTSLLRPCVHVTHVEQTSWLRPCSPVGATPGAGLGTLHTHQLPLPSRWLLVRGLTAHADFASFRTYGRNAQSLGSSLSILQGAWPTSLLWLSCVKITQLTYSFSVHGAVVTVWQ